MNKLVLTDEVLKALEALIIGAERCYGMMNVHVHKETLQKAIAEDKPTEEVK